MATSLYDMTVPVYTRALNNLSALLKKGEAFATEKGIDEADILDTRLIEDMHPLPYQVQRVSDTAKGVVVRIGGVENAVFEDNETTFEALQQRIARTLDFIGAVPRDAIDGKEDAPVELVTPNRTLNFTGQSYVLGFATPNLYFHVTTVYALLRMRGVPIGKMDFLGGQ